MNKKIGFIGAGSISKSLMDGLLHALVPADQLWVSNPTQAKLDVFSRAQVHVTTDNNELARHVDVIVLAVKPGKIVGVLDEIAEVVKQRKPLVISVATGVRSERLSQHLAKDIPVVRTMPNLCAMVGASATGMFATTNVNAEQKALAESLMRTVGTVVWVADEEQLDVLTGLSGSGPAYFFTFMQSLIDAGIALGLPPESAKLLTLQTALGAAHVALKSEADLKTLTARVTSPNGTTAAGLAVLQQGGLADLLQKTVARAAERAQELSKD